jgi:hypothetical protein
MDPYLCCLLGLCCPPFSSEQFEKLVAMRMERSGVSKVEAENAVTFDLELVKGIYTRAKAKKD